ncbi:MAG: PepSY-associated TM helix domain-containing protein [Pseudomonas sp.]
MDKTGSSRWYRLNLWLHRWCSLVATLPFLILCLTGTVLIFHEEIDAAMGTVPASASDARPHRPLQASIDNALAAHPGERVASIGIDAKEHPGLVLLVMVPAQAHKFEDMKLRFAELATAQPTEHVVDPTATLTGFLLELHAHWFLGMPGELIGALIALLVVVSLLSGVVVYWPHLKKVAFGLLRRGRGPRLRQLDLHNTIGAVVLGWALAVSLTGFLLGFGTLATAIWSSTVFADLREPHADTVIDARHPPVDADTAIAAAVGQVPQGWHVVSLIFPDTDYSTSRHYTALMLGPSGLEERLYRVGLVDATTGKVAKLVEMPGYMKAIVLSQPLHFGDYGGLPLKILWTLCTWLTLFITANGAWLWWDRRRRRKPGTARKPVAAAKQVAR